LFFILAMSQPTPTMKKAIFILFATIVFFSARAQNPYSFGVRIIGKGKPMILIPGNKGSADTYNEVVAHYKDKYTCYVITLAGFAGQPASDAHDHLLMRQRDEIIRYIIDVHLAKPVLVGFSFGGALAMWIAVTRPDLIGPLIELDATPFDAAVDADHLNKDSLVKATDTRYKKALAQTPAFWKKRDSVYHSPSHYQDGFVYIQKLLTDTGKIAETWEWDKASDFRASVLMNLESDTLDMRESVARIKSPILMLGSWKGYDLIKSKADAERRYGAQYDKAKNVTLIFSENGKHFLMYEDFDWMISEMDKFLKRTD
jgi:N-formylmaleamate deformylase